MVKRQQSAAIAARLQQAITFHQQGQLGRAEAALRKILAQVPAHFHALHLLGVLQSRKGRHQWALDLFKQALALDPGQPEPHANMGAALYMLGRMEEAVASFERALSLKPDFPEAFCNRGNALRDLKRPQEALASFDRALALKPDYAEALSNRGNALRDLKRPREALESCERALAINPTSPVAFLNRGNALQDLNRPAEALASFERASALHPDYAAAHFSEALCRLLMGDFERGWQKHEWRWREDQQKHSRRDFSRPLWSGREPIAGRTILLHAEQGLGDTIQFCRYAGLVAQRGAKIVLEVQAPLRSLLAGLQGVTRVLVRGEPLPAFDYHCPLLSLPLAFDTRLDTIPAHVPYLFSDADRVDEWRPRLGGKGLPRVGLVWSGSPEHKNDHNRSIGLADLGPLLAAPAQFVSLQKNVRRADKEVLGARRDILDLGDTLMDFSDTAALVELMDMVVTVDTAVAHLAGAMGKPVWVLLPFAPDWRWLLDREDSPWYPTARVARQPAPGDWASVIARTGAELGLAAGRGR